MSKTRVRSTAASAPGVVSIRNKRGDEMFKNPIGTDIPAHKIAWMIRVGGERLYRAHEHDFAPLFDGSKTLVCSCGAVQDNDGGVY